MSEPAFYLWVEERRPRDGYRHFGDEKPYAFSWMVPVDGKTVEEARASAIKKLDHHDLTRTIDNSDCSIHHAIIYEFKENVIGLYTKNKDERQEEIDTKKKQERLKQAEAEVTRLKRELGEG